MIKSLHRTWAYYKCVYIPHFGVLKNLKNNIYYRNALSITMMETLTDHILGDQENNDLRALVISAEGPVFSSGHNLKELVRVMI